MATTNLPAIFRPQWNCRDKYIFACNIWSQKELLLQVHISLQYLVPKGSYTGGQVQNRLQFFIPAMKLVWEVQIIY